MTEDQRARLAERITRHLRDNPPDGISLRLDGIEDIERGILIRFVTDRPMSTSDMRVPDAVNEALRATLEGDESVRGLRIDVRVDVEV